MKIQYRHNEGYTYVLVIHDDYSEMFVMDGSDEFPVTEDVETARKYLERIAPDIKYWSVAEQEMDEDETEEFLAWLDSDENEYDVCDAELIVGSED